MRSKLSLHRRALDRSIGLSVYRSIGLSVYREARGSTRKHAEARSLETKHEQKRLRGDDSNNDECVDETLSNGLADFGFSSGFVYWLVRQYKILASRTNMATQRHGPTR